MRRTSIDGFALFSCDDTTAATVSFLLSSQKYIAALVTFSSSQENQIVNEFHVFGQVSRVFSAIHSN